MVYWFQGGVSMKQKIQKILKQLAIENHTTPEVIRMEMQAAMEEGMKNPNPMIQAQWKQIPHKGTEPTLEEFMEYLFSNLSNEK